ncbi:AbrB/MazE/SpoVT family DNA-binding domain-containing protein [Neobacillus pocheonensis]|uniref:AbrB/MazE/SpoVT family DNA-binding domain-containing protein n=1 Tax=Neobacillus pocheonensis TaxID=363869 RepID=A0ABT0W633_9BACI|nr:AbrB/MazE/SpoVT family DNA-binding domain-containing protein [Neobacillus pocheonensis]MCM2534216.1 AbrB/MazE/SpoVT family DNA-binding domain-containing protein [Neobacillus pocheonensis]
MKSTGIVRKVDELGRIVIPIELRRALEIDLKDPVEIFVEGEQIILKKYSPNNACVLTVEVSDNNLTLAESKLILSREGAEKLIQEIQQSFELAK